MIPWLATKDPTLSVIIMMSIDVIAFIPTLRNAWNSLRIETPILYFFNVPRYIFALLSLSSYNIATTLHSIAMIVTKSTMSSLLLMSRRREK